MRTLPTPSIRMIPVFLSLGLLVGLLGCKQEDALRPATYGDIYGSWSSSGLTFESGGSIPTKAQLATFKNLEAASFTFGYDGSYTKRSLDSTLSSTTVLVNLERGTYTLSGNQLTLTTRDLLTQTSRNSYYNCYFSTKQVGSFVEVELSLQVPKELLLKSLDEQRQTNPFYQQNRNFLTERDLFKVSQMLRR